MFYVAFTLLTVQKTWGKIKACGVAHFRERNQSFWRVLQEIPTQLPPQCKCIIGFGRRVHKSLSNPPQQYPVHSNIGGRSNEEFPWSCPRTLRSFTAFKELHEEQDHHRQQVALASSKNTWYFGRKSPIISEIFLESLNQLLWLQLCCVTPLKKLHGLA